MFLQLFDYLLKLGEHDSLCNAPLIELTQLIERRQDQRLEPFEQLVDVTHEETPLDAQAAPRLEEWQVFLNTSSRRVRRC